MSGELPTSAHIPPFQIAMATENIDMTLDILRTPGAHVELDPIVFSFIDRKHLTEREHLQICCLTIGLLFMRLAAAEEPQ